MPLPDLTGWRLDEARSYLQNLELRIIETAPPKLREGDELGAARVLRWRLMENESADSHIELLVAREQISEARTANNLKTSP